MSHTASRILRKALILCLAATFSVQASPNNPAHENLPPLLQLSAAERQWLAAHPHIRLGVDPAWAPFEFIDQDGNYAGMAAEYMRVLSDLLGVTMEPVAGLSWTEVLEQAERRQLDLLPCAVMTPQRDAYLDFTEHYLNFPMVILTRTDSRFISGLEDLHGQKVAVIQGYASGDLIRTHFPDQSLMEVEDIRQGLHQLAVGEIDAFVDNLASVSYALKQMGITNVKVAATTPFSFQLAIGVRDDWPELVGILNKALDHLSLNTHDQIRDNWIAIRFEHGVDLPFIIKLALGSGLVIAFVMGMIIYSNRRLALEVAKRRKVEQDLERLTVTDPLTGLLNRRQFHHLVQQELQRAKRHGLCFCFMLLDLDYFKQYNDTYGHLQGDEALRRLAGVLRDSSQRAGDFAFRLGGEEFGLITTHSDVEAAKHHAAAILQAVRQQDIPHSGSPHGCLTLSIGMTCLPRASDLNADEVFHRADKALYEAKDAGRNTVICGEA